MSYQSEEYQSWLIESEATDRRITLSEMESRQCECCDKKKYDCKRIDGDWVICQDCIDSEQVKKFFNEIEYEFTNLKITEL
jgi:hypothetical protein